MRATVFLLMTAVVLMASANVHAQADEEHPVKLVLKSGGELTGIYLKDKMIEGKKHILFQTESGGVLQLHESRIVSKVIRLDDPVGKGYERRRQVAKSPQTHWEAIQYCELQKGGKSRFKEEIEFHLREIVKQDPNDEKAWRRLGYTRIDGVWTDKDRMYAESGYVKERGWTSKAAVELGKQLQEADANAKDARARVTKWVRLLKNKPGEASATLRLVCDADTVVHLFQFATSKKKVQPPAIRRAIMEAISEVNSVTAVNALVYFAVEDPDLNIQDTAMTLLENSKNINPNAVLGCIVRSKYLVAENPTTIDRAAHLLGRMGNESAILPLIGSLTTTHTRVNNTGQGRTKTNVVNGGIQSFGVEGGPKTSKVLRRNESVLNALVRITDQRLPIDKGVWKAWYIDTYTHMEMDVRADDDE